MIRAGQVPQRPTAGFTLIEVLVAMVVVAIGLLGLAKMQATALSSTQVNGARSLIAFQTNSLAAAMRANRAFWASAAAANTFSMQGSTVSDTAGVLGITVPTCAASSLPSAALCSPARLAARDAQNWAASMAAQFPTYSATGSCSAPANAPVNCLLTVRWLEKFVAAGAAGTVDSDATGGQRSFTLYIEP